MQVGDIAKVIWPGEVYSSYVGYIEHYCPELHARFYYEATHVKRNDEVRVLCTGKHLRYSDKELCVVESCDPTQDWVQIIGCSGLELLMPAAEYEIDVSSDELMSLLG